MVEQGSSLARWRKPQDCFGAQFFVMLYLGTSGHPQKRPRITKKKDRHPLLALQENKRQITQLRLDAFPGARQTALDCLIAVALEYAEGKVTLEGLRERRSQMVVQFGGVPAVPKRAMKGKGGPPTKRPAAAGTGVARSPITVPSDDGNAGGDGENGGGDDDDGDNHGEPPEAEEEKESLKGRVKKRPASAPRAQSGAARTSSRPPDSIGRLLHEEMDEDLPPLYE